ncbi:MAG: hypothetical protein H7Z17_12900 [Fuerstia sp.]|nr:hypothetical protein [Fuerstiella sp.]
MPCRLLILFTTVTGAALLLAPWPPLGVPGEWVWPRHPLPTDFVEALDRLIWPLICGSVVVAFCAAGLRRIDRAGSMHRGLLLLGLTGLSFLWLNAVRQAAPSPHRELRPVWILYDKYASGYFFEATFNVSSTQKLLAEYESRMAKGDVLHEGTHPPGLLLLNRGLLKLTAEFPVVVRFSEAVQSSETVRMFREVEAAGQMARPLSESEFAALHLSSLLSTLFAAMTVVPVFGLTRRLTDSRTAWRAAALMITVPTIGIFVPRSDVLYACSGMLLAWAAVAAILTQRRIKRWVLAVLSGFILFGCLLLSLAHVPVVVMLAVFAVGFVLLDLKDRCGPLMETIVAAAVSFFIACEAWQHCTGCNLFNVWRMNLANHAGFYSQSVRTWYAWFAVNPIELAMAVGLPMAAMAIVMLVQSMKSIRFASPKSLTNGRLFAIACALTWTLLWLSGKNMGEAARLWCFLTPWIAIIAAQAVDSDAANTQRTWLVLLIAQLAIATITVGRVSGFLEF